MNKFLLLTIWLLLTSGELFGQSYGLQFSSHEIIPEKRTSLNLTPNDPICLNGEIQISYDFKFAPNFNVYFGYVKRVLTIDGQNVDIVSGIQFEQSEKKNVINKKN